MKWIAYRDEDVRLWDPFSEGHAHRHAKDILFRVYVLWSIVLEHRKPPFTMRVVLQRRLLKRRRLVVTLAFPPIV